MMVRKDFRTLSLHGPGSQWVCRFLAVQPQVKLLSLSVPRFPYLWGEIHNSTHLMGDGQDQEANARGAFARVSAWSDASYCYRR